jgi:hypothetical protein
MASIESLIRSPCMRGLEPRPRLKRGVDCGRGWGSSEALIVLEDRAQASRWLRLWSGLGRVAGCTTGYGSGLIAYPYSSKFLFCRFLPSCLGYPDLRYPQRVTPPPVAV